jgi:hypothetical protein
MAITEQEYSNLLDERNELLWKVERLRAALELARPYVDAYCNDRGVVKGMAEQNLKRIDAALANEQEG